MEGVCPRTRRFPAFGAADSVFWSVQALSDGARSLQLGGVQLDRLARVVERMNQAPRPLYGDLMSALDPVEILAGFAWTTATVALTSEGHAWRVGTIKTTRQASDTDRGIPALDLDPGAWMGACQVAFGRLRESLEAEGIAFPEGTLHARRQDLESLHVALVAPDGVTVAEFDIARETARGQLLSDDLCRLLADGAPDWLAQQQALARKMRGLVKSSYRGRSATLEFEFDDGESFELPVQILGSYSRTQYSWCWSWANRSYEPIDYHRVANLRDEAVRMLGVGALWRPAFFSDERFATLVAHFAAEQLGAVGTFSRRIAEDVEVTYALFNRSG